MIKNPLNILSKGVSVKSTGKKFGVLVFLIGFSTLLIFLAGIIALMGTFWTNIK